MTEALSPQREAMKLTQLWRAVHGLVFPIAAGQLAQEWSRQVAPEGPILELQSADLQGFEGGLFWLKQKKGWALLYHPHPELPGRSNFTIAHEFGHFVLHRKLQERFQCSQDSTLGMVKANIEREADQFASYLLMPIDDFRNQIGTRHITLDLLGECAKRYGVSLTAALLKWVDLTEQSAIVVMGREGMLHWWRASTSAKKYAFGRLREGMELPHASLAAAPAGTGSADDYRLGVDHPKGIWFTDIAVREMVMTSDRYDMAISVLILDTPGAHYEEEPDDDMTTRPPSF